MSVHLDAELPEEDDGEVRRVENVLHMIECAMRNIRVDRSDPRLAEYNRFRSELLTLREQAMTSRWPAEVRRVVDACMSIRDQTAYYTSMSSISLEQTVHDLRGDDKVKCMFCQNDCDASTMKFYHLFGLPEPPKGAVACGARPGPAHTPPNLDGYSARKWLKADFAKLEKLCVEFVRCYDRPEAELKAEVERARAGATKTPPAEFLGAFALGSECAQYFEATMHVQSLPMVEAHDVQIMVVNCIEDKSNDIESINDMRNIMFKDDCEAASVARDLRSIRDFVAGRRNVRLPDIVGPGPLGNTVNRVRDVLAENSERERARPRRPFVVDESDDDSEPERVNAPERFARAICKMDGARARESLDVARARIAGETSESDEAGSAVGSSRRRAKDGAGGEEHHGGKRKRSEKEAAQPKAAGKRASGRPPRKAAAQGRAELRRSARADSENSDHPSDDERESPEEVSDAESLAEFKQTMRAKRLSIETQREEQMIDSDGFSARETSAAMAASAPASAAERAGRLGDDVLALLGDVMRSGEVDDAEVWNSLQTAGATLFRVKRALAAANQQDNGAGVGA